MSGHPQGGQYDDGYGQAPGHAQQGQDAYYHDDQYGQYHDDGHGQYAQGQHGDAYYDESYVFSPLLCPRRSIANHTAVLITMASRAVTTNRMAITTNEAASKATRTSTTRISTTTKAAHRTVTLRMGTSLSPSAPACVD